LPCKYEPVGAVVRNETYIREVLGSNLDQDAGYPLLRFFVVFLGPCKKIPA
jgi:hypothetical protein